MTSPARIRSPVSSQVSRTAACSGLSPDSILPAGNVHGGFPRGPRIRKLCSRQCSIYEYRFRRVSRAYTHSHDPVQSYSSAADTVFRIPKALAPPHGVRRPDGETDRRLRRRGRAAETRSGRSGCRRCPRSGSRAEMGTTPGSSSGSGPGRRPSPGTLGQSRPLRPRPPGRRRMRLPGASIALFGHHAERGGRSGRTYAYPPIGATADTRLTRLGAIAELVDTNGRPRTSVHASGRTSSRWQGSPADYSPKPRNTPSSPAAPAKSSQSIFEMFRLLSTPHNSDGMHRKGVRPAISGNSATDKYVSDRSTTKIG